MQKHQKSPIIIGKSALFLIPLFLIPRDGDVTSAMSCSSAVLMFSRLMFLFLRVGSMHSKDVRVYGLGFRLLIISEVCMQKQTCHDMRHVNIVCDGEKEYLLVLN